MGEEQGTLFPLDFNRSVRVEARRERLTADAGAVLLRSLLGRLGFDALARKHLHDPREAGRVRHGFVELLRTALLLQAQGWTSDRDADLLRTDAALRLAVSSRRGTTPVRQATTLASQPTLSRLVAALSTASNRAGLSALLLDWAERRAVLGGRADEVTLDLDSLPIEVHGAQPGTAWNRHYGCRCYHPLLLRSDRGDFLAASLREGNVHTAEGALGFVLPALRRVKASTEHVWLRVDAGFPEPELLSALEAEGVRYVARLRGNTRLDALAAPFLKRPAGRPPAEGRLWTHELSYGARSWQQERRVVLVVLERADAQQHLFLDHFFLLTNVPAKDVDGAALLERYRQRGDAERDFGDWKSTLEVSLSSAPRPKAHYRGRAIREDEPGTDSFAANEVRLLLSLLAANLLRAGAELLARDNRHVMTRQRFRQLMLRVAGRVVQSGRTLTLVIESSRAALWRDFWRELDRHYPTRGSPTLRTLPTPA
jgi:hypothetical protein